MAGSIEVTETDLGAGLTHYSVAWVADTNGAVSENTMYLRPGLLRMFGFAPDAGDTQPTTLYDVTLPCVDHGVDTFGGSGANLANNATTHAASLSWTHGGLFVPTVANAGSENGGTILIWVQRP